jgi:chromosome segregation ATPase
MGPARSGGPTGIDPFGKCPKNPTDGKLLDGNADYDNVVNERIQDLESRLSTAERRLKQISPSKAKLADRLASAEEELFKKKQALTELQNLILKNI